jgi:sulfur carrier protein ThiS
VPTGTRIRDLIDLVGLPQGEVSIVSRQGVLADKDDPLRDGDDITLYPPIGGGC